MYIFYLKGWVILTDNSLDISDIFGKLVHCLRAKPEDNALILKNICAIPRKYQSTLILKIGAIYFFALLFLQLYNTSYIAPILNIRFFG